MCAWHREQVLIEAELLFLTMPGIAGISSTLMTSRKEPVLSWTGPHRLSPHLVPTNRIRMRASSLAGPVTSMTGSLFNNGFHSCYRIRFFAS
jgi:hypothetical protein